MLIRFRVSNFLSYKEEIEFSMIPGKSRKHPEHKVSGGNSRHSTDLLRCSIIYGANASGKSNLAKALSFMQDLVVDGTKINQSIQVKTFKLDRAYSDKSSRFEVEIRIDGKDYLYGFEITTKCVVSEWLYQVKLTTQDELFERHTTSDDTVVVTFGSSIPKADRNQEFLDFIAKGTRPNQLYLTECAEKNVPVFRPVYQWFSDTLTIVFPEAYVRIYEKVIDIWADFLMKFDTGICGVSLRPVEIGNKLSNSAQQNLQKSLSDKIKEETQVDLKSPKGERIVVTLEDGNLVARELVFRHKSINCDTEIDFNLTEESEGTKRLIDLLPILYTEVSEEQVYVFDELDRSLHPSLCYELIELFLAQSNNHIQLIATTHESNLLDLNLLRRDEIWFIEKDQTGASKVYSLEEFTPRYDKDIKKGYLLGRFGAIPILGNVKLGKG